MRCVKRILILTSTKNPKFLLCFGKFSSKPTKYSNKQKCSQNTRVTCDFLLVKIKILLTQGISTYFIQLPPFLKDLVKKYVLCSTFILVLLIRVSPLIIVSFYAVGDIDNIVEDNQYIGIAIPIYYKR